MELKEAKTFCQELINLYREAYDLPIILQLKDVQCGSANYRTRKLTTPLWLFGKSNKYFNANSPMAFQYWYVLHEISHFINCDNYGNYGHHKTFRGIERKLLKDFGLTPIYSRAYIRQLLYDNGETAYRR